MLLDQVSPDLLQVAIEQAEAGFRLLELLVQHVRARIHTNAGGPRPSEQPGQKFSAIGRHFHQRLVEQMLEHVLAADIQNERHLWLESDEIREVLLRPHAKINPAGPY